MPASTIADGEPPRRRTTRSPGRSICHAARRGGPSSSRRDPPKPGAASPPATPRPCSPRRWRRQRRESSIPTSSALVAEGRDAGACPDPAGPEPGHRLDRGGGAAQGARTGRPKRSGSRPQTPVADGLAAMTSPTCPWTSLCRRKTSPIRPRWKPRAAGPRSSWVWFAVKSPPCASF